MRLSPTLHKMAIQSHNPHCIVEDNVDFWYDAIQDCYENQLPNEYVMMYLDAINEEFTHE